MQSVCKNGNKGGFPQRSVLASPTKARGTVTTDSYRNTFVSVLSDFENAALTF